MFGSMGVIMQDTQHAAALDEQSIVIVDDMPDNLRLLVGILMERGYKVRPASSGARALATVRKEPPSLILLDIMMPEMNGYEVCRELKADKRLKDIPVIFLSALNDVRDKVKAYSVGGMDYIPKPFQVEEVLVRVGTHLKIIKQRKDLERKNEALRQKNALISEQAKKLEQIAARDFLTGLSNRRDFLKKAQWEERRFERNRNPFSIIMLDVDHFKRVNDKYGHDCGDRTLINIAIELKKTLRSQDVVARWGGEEFACLLPETKIAGAQSAAGKIRRNIKALRHECRETQFSVTVTMGIATYDGSCSLEECVQCADEALYKGKESGRNIVMV